MATVKYTTKTCDRCGFGKEKPATEERIFAIGDLYYKVDLCLLHSQAFDRDIGIWIQLAAEIDNPYDNSAAPRSATYTPELLERSRAVNDQHDAVLRNKEESIFAQKQRERLIEEAEQQAMNKIPGAKKWTLTRHARERLLLRGFTFNEVLMAVTIPATSVRQSWRGPDIAVYMRDGCRVVVNDRTHIVITVIDRNDVLETAETAQPTQPRRQQA